MFLIIFGNIFLVFFVFVIVKLMSFDFLYEKMIISNVEKMVF